MIGQAPTSEGATTRAVAGDVVSAAIAAGRLDSRGCWPGRSQAPCRLQGLHQRRLLLHRLPGLVITRQRARKSLLGLANTELCRVARLPIIWAAANLFTKFHSTIIKPSSGLLSTNQTSFPFIERRVF